MSGILNSKNRILDTVITAEGRRQIAARTFKISFASFTDNSSFYEADIISGSRDASERIYFEAPTSLSKDQVAFETNDAGQLIPYYGSGDHLFMSNGMISSSGSITSISSENFASLASELMGSSIDNFKNMQLIGSLDTFVDEQGFEISTNNITFTVTDKFPFDTKRDITSIDIDHVESFFHDKRLSHLPNFMYLPPVNANSKIQIGNFPSHGQEKIQTYTEIEQIIVNREKSFIEFPITSRENNLFAQFFELSNGKMTKLDIIDFGDFNTNDDLHPTKQVFFVGKIYIDSTGNGTFANQFVLIFD